MSKTRIETRAKKAQEIDVLKAAFEGAQSVVLADFKGLDMDDTNALRKSCREKGVQLRVVKNTLARIASQGTEYEELFKDCKENTALAYSDEDPAAAAKAITEFVKGNGKAKLKSGAIPGKVLDEKELIALSKLPGKLELQAKLLGLLNAVPTNFVRLLNEVPTSFVRLLAAYRDQKEQNQ